MIAAVALSVRGAAYMAGWVTGKLLAAAIGASVRWRP
jgi:hypothetical protein